MSLPCHTFCVPKRRLIRASTQIFPDLQYDSLTVGSRKLPDALVIMATMYFLLRARKVSVEMTTAGRTLVVFWSVKGKGTTTMSQRRQ